MLGRAVFAFLACPGMVAFVIPIFLVRLDAGTLQPGLPGLVLVTLGTVLLLWCVREFYVAGKGTLAPWAPPRDLVTAGPYRFSRNPMYIAVMLVLLGWTVGFWSRLLLLYTVGVIVAFQLRVVFGEEPWLARTFGEDWQHYAARVPRWLF